MRSETVEEFLKRGGKINYLKEEVGSKVYGARESTNKKVVNAFTVRTPELRDWAVKEGIIL